MISANSGIHTLHCDAPWSFNRSQLRQTKRTQHFQSEEIRTTASYACGLWLTFYQQHLSAIMRSKCAMVPSCSTYSRQAVRKHGVLIGIVMSADRLLHEGNEFQTSEAVRKGPRIVFLDALEHNDFWWTKK
ncbi:MAG: membrane protein insertion efficiency factor YidD [Kiritimatiellae bacterium]|nr:membrane protein insertion efficiency factor YidD [Kiritimatiellia bacterium]